MDVFRFVFVLAFLGGLSSAGVLRVADISVERFAEEIERWMNQSESQFFSDAVEVLRLPTILQRADWRTFSNGVDLAICTVCKSFLKTFIAMRRNGLSDEGVRTKAAKLCTLLNLQTPEVCEGVVDLNLPILLYIVDSKENLTSDTICGVLLESRYCPLSDPLYEWSILVDNGPSVAKPADISGNDLKILQITDIHYDPNYEVNGNAECLEPTCCRRGQNETGVRKLAGYWGDYNSCDTPWHAVEDAFEQIASTHNDLDYVYFTGDIIDHGVWETSKEGNIESLSKIYDKIHETFSIPVYPILGNHEPHPLNQFAPQSITREDLSTQWLYEFLANLWISYGWLPESVRSTILQGGFYTVSPRKGFRVIVLNSNVCYNYNWWLLYEPRDPDGQLQWLADTLAEAERNGELVHILTHIPAGNKNCLNTWKREYQKVVSRFSRIIRAQFNGHTHYDEFQVFYDSEKTPQNIAWNGGSVTAYSNLNPNYKVFDVDGRNLTVTNYDNWMYNLTDANLDPTSRPFWYKSYSFKEEYKLKDLSFESLHDFLLNAANDDQLLNTYYKHFFKQAEPSLQSACDSSCKKKYLCRSVASIANSCEEILNA